MSMQVALSQAGFKPSESVNTLPTQGQGLTIEELMAQVASLQEQLKAKTKSATPGMKISEKGCLSVYGLGRFPVTLYKSQWDKLLGMADQIREFIKANESLLATKEKASA